MKFEQYKHPRCSTNQQNFIDHDFIIVLLQPINHVSKKKMLELEVKVYSTSFSATKSGPFRYMGFYMFLMAISCWGNPFPGGFPKPHFPWPRHHLSGAWTASACFSCEDPFQSFAFQRGNFSKHLTFMHHIVRGIVHVQIWVCMYDVTVPPKNAWSVPHRVWALGFWVLGFRFFVF